MKLNNQQANHLQRLFNACENAKDFSEDVVRQERLNNYMERLMDEGIDSQEIVDLLY